jgi:hypothetical protein
MRLREIIANEIRRALAYRLVLATPPPSKNFPPSHIVTWIELCNQYERKDLGSKIMQAWNNMIDKYPKARVRWEVAVPIGNNSIKKNVFGGKDFKEWFPIQVGHPIDVAIPEMKVKSSGVGAPRVGETPQDFNGAAAKTAGMLVDIDQAFGSADELIDYLKNEVDDIERKISEYGPGGKKELTKTGAPSSFSKRVPKWQGQLKAYKDKLDDVGGAVDKSKKTIVEAKKAYETAPATVAFEEGMQGALDVALERILNMEDLEKQQAMLIKFQKMTKELERQKSAGFREAGIFDSLFSGFDKFISFLSRGWKSIVNWARGVIDSTDQVKQWASFAGR